MYLPSFTFHYFRFKPRFDQPVTLAHTYLHSTILDSNNCQYNHLIMKYIFTFHYFRFKQIGKGVLTPLLTLFTFHYFRFKQISSTISPVSGLNLHSTILDSNAIGAFTGLTIAIFTFHYFRFRLDYKYLGHRCRNHLHSTILDSDGLSL